MCTCALILTGCLCSVTKIWQRQELLTTTIGARAEETASYDISVVLLTWVLLIFLVFSLLELLSFLAYEHWVSTVGQDAIFNLMKIHSSFILGRKLSVGRKNKRNKISNHTYD